MLFSLGDLWRSGSVSRRALSLKAGGSKVQVRKALGRPGRIFTPLPQVRPNIMAWLLSVRSETWAYGRRFDLGLAFQGDLPILFRMFGPEEHDVSVVFDSSARVAEVIIAKNAP